MRTKRLLTGAAAAALLVVAGCGHTESAPEAGAPFASQHFRSRPDLRPPTVNVLARAHGTAPGYLFIAPKKLVEQSGPMIVDDGGQVLWFRPLETRRVADFRAQRYRGRPVLTWWRGEMSQNIGNGHYVILDDSYRTIATVHAANGLSGDLHEFLLTPRGTALLTIFRRVPYEFPALGFLLPGEVIEGVVQEVDVATGRLLFEWHSLDHVSVDESYEPRRDLSDPYDYFHLNSIDVDADGNLLVSARNTHAVYKVRRRDGAVLWRLGGKRSDFAIDPDGRFAWQHDARRQPDGTITVFDNESLRPKRGLESRVLVLRLDERRRRATVLRSYTHPDALLSTSQGNAQVLRDGHVLVGWGSEPRVTEFARDGSILLDVAFGGGRSNSYRAYRFRWSGHPPDRPAVTVQRDGRDSVVYASWNGATEVAGWRVFAGADPAHLKVVTRGRKTGFETALRVVGQPPVFRVAALDASGRVIRMSRLIGAEGLIAGR